MNDTSRPDDNPILGMAAALAAFFLFTVMNVFAKLLADEHSVIEIAFWRNLVALLPFLGIALLAPRRGIHRLQAKPGLVITRPERLTPENFQAAARLTGIIMEQPFANAIADPGGESLG